jgi:hypothetical protein
MFNNNEEIARSDGKQIFIKCPMINQLMPLINKNYIKWIGVNDKKGKWKYVIYRSLNPDPSPYFLNFADKHAVDVKGNYYLTHKFDQDTLFDYIEAEIDHLADYGNYAQQDSPEILLNIKGHGNFNNNEVVAGVTDISSLDDAFIYDIDHLRGFPARYSAGRCIVRFLPNNKAVYVDMKVIDALMPEIENSQFKWLGFREGTYFDYDVVWGEAYQTK